MSRRGFQASVCIGEKIKKEVKKEKLDEEEEEEEREEEEEINEDSNLIDDLDSEFILPDLGSTSSSLSNLHHHQRQRVNQSQISGHLQRQPIKRSQSLNCTADDVDAAKLMAMDLYTNCGSIDTSPIPSPLTPNDCQQDMFCSSTMSGDCSSNTSLEAGEGHSHSHTITSNHSHSHPKSTNQTANNVTNASSASSANGDNGSPKRLCLVCGDTASGFHYGVASCEACKAFFKRTIQGNIEYQCPATNDCEINKRRRKACQACRFQKCLRMGMLKEGVRLDRVRGGRQKYRRTPENCSNTSSNNVLNSHNSQGNTIALIGNSTANQIHSTSTITSSSFQVLTSCNCGPNGAKATLEGNKMVTALLNCEPEPLVLCNSSSSSSLISGILNGSTNGSSLNSLSNVSIRDRGISILSDLVDKELVATISWAKQIPGFTDLILNDQMRLLQTTWGEILSLSLAYRSQSQVTNVHNNGLPCKLYFASDFVMDETLAIQVRGEEMFTLSCQLVKRLAGLRLAKEEFLVLKALLLTNVDIPLEDASAVCKLRENILCSLSDCVITLRNNYNHSLHLAQMLLVLPLLRQTDAAIRRFWSSVRRDGKVAMNKLFVEMLESNVSLR